MGSHPDPPGQSTDALLHPGPESAAMHGDGSDIFHTDMPKMRPDRHETRSSLRPALGKIWKKTFFWRKDEKRLVEKPI